MVPRRRIVLTVLLVSLLATGTFVLLAIINEPTDASVQTTAGRQAGPAAPTDPGPARSGLVETETTGAGVLHIVFWAAALVSGIVVMISGLLARMEVRQEKARIRHERVRSAVADDLRAFRQARRLTERRDT